ncbi:hypothetical protein [Leptotrichia sp. OH3620_COT-345]|nr:hypothetical protein [Leptotrichia sp. OH3620_COT-345]
MLYLVGYILIYLFGKSEYGNENRGFGVYQKDSEYIFITGEFLN